MEKDNLEEIMLGLGRDARAAARELARASEAQKNEVLTRAAAYLREESAALCAANAQDMEEAKTAGVNAARLDRIMIDAARVEAIASAVEAIAALPDPIGAALARWQVPSGLDIERRSTPLGVVGIIYESRPNVTADAAALCLKSGNAVILRGSAEITQSACFIHGLFVKALRDVGLAEACVQLVPTRERAAVGYLLQGLDGALDVIVPRGGHSLVERVEREARVPVFGHLEGLCHVYVHGDAKSDMAERVVVNAKMRRTGICGAAETLLIDKSWDKAHTKSLLGALIAAGCELRGSAEICALEPRANAASEEDWHREYLDAILAVRFVDGLDEALAHIAHYGSAHTEAIITQDEGVADEFLSRVDSAIVMHNASTQFADGGEFGMGAEIGIATGRFHARGPVGLNQLTSFKYVVRGAGQARPK